MGGAVAVVIAIIIASTIVIIVFALRPRKQNGEISGPPVKL